MPELLGEKLVVGDLTAVGMTCGIGSMLLGARQAGFRILGNIEWRKYYHAVDSEGRNTFKENFPGAFMIKKMEDLPVRLSGVDLVMGHPECGNFSILQTTTNKVEDPGDIPLFLEAVAKISPRFFLMDDLPKSFISYPLSKYAELLPEYDLFPEWVSNFNYGCIQKARNRLFVAGALKSERFAFSPGEEVNLETVEKLLSNIPEGTPNHWEHTTNMGCCRARSLGDPQYKPTWGEVKDRFLNELLPGQSFPYKTISGEIYARIGFLKTHWKKPSHVLTGGNAIIHPITGLPLSIRERARMQGFPDDFIFYGGKLEVDGKWEHHKNQHLVKQTGKAMPIQFNRYFSQQVRAHIKGQLFESSGTRLIKPNVHVDTAKSWFCSEIGYADQRKNCEACWMKRECNLPRRQI